MSLTTLPPEIGALCLASLPDFCSLQNAIVAHAALYRTFLGQENFITTEVLQNKLGPGLYMHAIVHQFLSSRRESSTKVPATGASVVASVESLPAVRESCRKLDCQYSLAASSTRKILYLNKIVRELCQFVMEDRSRVTEVYPMYSTARFRYPSPAESTRVQQAIYLFGIMTMAWHNHPAIIDNTEQPAGSLERDLDCMWRDFMAPWEMYQVAAIMGVFERAVRRHYSRAQSETPPGFHVTNGNSAPTDASIQGILASGLEAIHYLLCGPNSLTAKGTGPRTVSTHVEAGGVFFDTTAEILRSIKSRQWPLQYCQYDPFVQGDETAFRSWRTLNEKHVDILDNVPGGLVMGPELLFLADHFGFWGTIFWDQDRWDDVIHTVARSHLAYLLHAPFDLDPVAVETLFLEEAIALEEM